MAEERLQFHEMGIDDRLLKVTNGLTMSVSSKLSVDETLDEQLASKNRREAKKSRRKHGSYEQLR